MMLQGGEAAGDEAAEVGASFISGRLAALEVAEGEEAVPEPLDNAAAAAVRAELQAGLLAHAQGAGHGFCTRQSGSAGRRRSTSRHLGTCKVQNTDSVLSIKNCRETLDRLPGTHTPHKQTLRPQASTAGKPDGVGDLAAGAAAWSRCEALTAGLAGELAEQLRLILEPTVASRLAGDYRSGAARLLRAGRCGACISAP
jgi:hypothetical protein